MMQQLADIDKVVAETIVVYTIKNKNPKSGKEDCPITVRDKEQFRRTMKSRLMAAKTEQERQNVIDHYKQLFSE